MASSHGMFSESWHRVAGERVRLSPSVQAHKQIVHGETWYVLQDRARHEFFRIRPAAWAFLARLKGDRTVEEVWKECLELFPEESPGQEEAIRLLSQLHQNNLLQSTAAPDSEQLFKRFQKQRKKKIRGQALNFLFIHLPLFNPNRLLHLLTPLARAVFSLPGFMIWLVVLILGIRSALGNSEELIRQVNSAISPDNLIWLYLCMAGIKLFHELGHALACKRFGGDVYETGIMLMIFTPLPYVDASASWIFGKKSHRLVVDAAGLYVEFLIAAIAVMVWAGTGDAFISRLAYNILFISSISTILFNLNPLLRFDGYYLLSDGVEIPNLYSRSTRQLQYLCERFLFKVEAAVSPALDAREVFWLTLYGIGSWIYRIFLLSFIVYQVSTRFFGLGVLIAGFCLILYFVVPLGKLLKYLFFSERLERTRKRALILCGGLAVLLIGLLTSIPFPRHATSPGLIRASSYHPVVGTSEGFVAERLTPSPSRVVAGQPLLQLKHEELDQRIRVNQQALEDILTRIDQARQQGQIPLLEPLRLERNGFRYLIEQLEKRKSELRITAPADGIWSSPMLRELEGTWVPRGTEVGAITDTSSIEFLAAVSQRDAAALVNQPSARADIRLPGRAEQAFAVDRFRISPSEQTTLPSPALGWKGGGPLEVDPQSPDGTETKESFFLVTAEIANPPQVLHHQTGRIRFHLEPEPLIQQGLRALRQLWDSRR